MSRENSGPSLFSGVMLAYALVLLHVLLVAGLGIFVIFFRGVVAYMPFIFFIGLSAVGGSAYYLFRRLRSRGNIIRDALNSPLISGKSIEISLLGGMASIKIDTRDSRASLPAIEGMEQQARLLLEDRKSARIRELTALARQLENDQPGLTTGNKSKRNLFH